MLRYIIGFLFIVCLVVAFADTSEAARRGRRFGNGCAGYGGGCAGVSAGCSGASGCAGSYGNGGGCAGSYGNGGCAGGARMGLFGLRRFAR